MSTSHSIKLLTCWLVILLNFQPVDYSLYWTSDLSTSHSIERPTCRPVIVLNCRIVDQSLYILDDPSTSDSNDFRFIDQWLLIFLSVKQSVPLSYDKICRQVRQVVLLTHWLLAIQITWLSTCQQVNPMTHPSWISNSIVDHSSYMYLHY